MGLLNGGLELLQESPNPSEILMHSIQIPALKIGPLRAWIPIRTYKMTINAKEFEFTGKESFFYYEEINESDAGVKITYMSTADKLVN